MIVLLLWSFTLGASDQPTTTQRSYWTNQFTHPNGSWVFSCDGLRNLSALAVRTPTADNPSFKSCDSCDCSHRRNEITIQCQVCCQASNPLPECFNPTDGSLTTEADKAAGREQRYCTFSIRLGKAQGEKFYKLPIKPKYGTEECHPAKHECGFIERKCLHKEQLHDQFDKNNVTCTTHPMYCAHKDEEFLKRHDGNLPDCVNVNMENFHTYLYDITPWGSYAADMPSTERTFVCICDHPMPGTVPDGVLTFADCRNSVEAVFDKLLDLKRRDLKDYCNQLNPIQVFGINNVNSSRYYGETNDECRRSGGSLIRPSWGFLITCLSTLLVLAVICLFFYLRNNRSRSSDPGENLTGVTPIDTPLLPLPQNGQNGHYHHPMTATSPNHGVDVFDGSVETKVIPHILQQYPNMFLMRDLPLTKDMVLRGGDRNLEMLLQKRLVNEHNYLRILTEVSWWLMELHGEYKSWKVFFAAIEPKNIGIFELDGAYHAYIMKYELAQVCVLIYARGVKFAHCSDIGKLSNGTVTIPCSGSLINRKYQPPELIKNPERNEPRALLSADVYSFACIAWKVLRVISDESGTQIDPAEDPFDGEIRQLELETSHAMDHIFQDVTKRPSFHRINCDKYHDIVKIIKATLRLTSAQLYFRLSALMKMNE